MVDVSDKIDQIKLLIVRGCYFTINRARQYGKTTILTALAKALEPDYRVISLDSAGLVQEVWDDIMWSSVYIVGY